MFCEIKQDVFHILSLSGCFLLLFAAETTFINMQKVIVSSISDDVPGFKVEGYRVISVLYFLMSAFAWVGPYITHTFGAKLTMVVCACGYLFHLLSYSFENALLIYAGAVVIGISAGVLWPAQCHYMINISSRETTPRNVAIFWISFPTSALFGNIFVYSEFYGKKYIDQHTRKMVIYMLAAINVSAIVAFTLLPKAKTNVEKKEYGPITNIKKSFKMLFSPRMLWMCLTFIYSGLQQSFCHGIYGPSVGFTLAFGNSAKQLVALSGIFMGIGFILGAACPLMFSKWIKKHRHIRKMIIFLGIFTQLVAYGITFINLPNSATFGNTEEIGFIQPSTTLAMVSSVLLTFGDACLITQTYSIIGDYYRDNSAEACALYKFVKGITIAFNFFWVKHVGLHNLIYIMSSVSAACVLGITMADQGFITVEEEDTKASGDKGPAPIEKA